MEQFINYQLKVIEAKNQEYDTTKEFQKEFNKYKKQLQDSYTKLDDKIKQYFLNKNNRSNYES